MSKSPMDGIAAARINNLGKRVDEIFFNQPRQRRRGLSVWRSYKCHRQHIIVLTECYWRRRRSAWPDCAPTEPTPLAR